MYSRGDDGIDTSSIYIGGGMAIHSSTHGNR